MKPKILIFFILISFGYKINAQGEATNWYFGNGAGLSFAGGSPTVVTGGAITTSLGCSAVSNTLGNLLFYTDGVTVYNQTHSVMANGTGLLGDNAFQSAMIIKQPQSANIYYIFTVGGVNSVNGLNYSIVDMSLAAGMGSVTAKNILVFATSRDKLTAGKHCNGNDIWIVSSGGTYTANFVSCLLTSAGVTSLVTSPTGTNIGTVLGIGEMKLSPNSRKLSVCSYDPSPTACSIDLRIFDFDNITGEVVYTNTVVSFYLSGSYFACTFPYDGGEFSPNSKYFYYSIGQGITKLDLCSPTTTLSYGFVYNQESTTVVDTSRKKTMQLSPDGKIYVAQPGRTSLGVINNPNNISGPATYTSGGVSLNTYTCQWGLPNFPGYYFEQKPSPNFSYTVSPNSCITASFSTPYLCSSAGYSVTGYQWNFGDFAASSVSTNISFLSNPVHAYATPGSYTVSLIRYFMCNTNDTITQVINFTQPTITVTNSSNVCTTTSASVSVTGGIGPYSYLWSPGSQTNTSATFSASGVYTVFVTDQGSGACVTKSNVYVSVISLSATVNNNNILCFGQNTATASVLTLGGSGNYLYNWSIPSTSISTISSLGAGAYSVTVLDNVNNCSISKSFTITQPLAINMQVAASSSPCAGQSVYVVANVTGGTPVINYLWNTGGTNPYITTTQSLSGNYIYTCTVNDGNACALSKTISVTFYPYPVLTISNATVCYNNPLVLQANGAANYTWLPSGLSSPSLSLLPTSNLVYTLTGESNGCLTKTLVNIVVNQLPIVNVNSNSPLCVGQNLLLNATNHSTYFWNGPVSFTSATQNPSLSNVGLSQTGTYSLVVTDINNCTASKSIQVIVNPLPSISITGNQTICIGQTTTLTASGANSYSWSTNNTFNYFIVVSPSVSTNYTATGTMSMTSCSNTASLLVNVSKCTGLIEIEEDLNSKVYPNPNNGKFTIEIVENTQVVIVNTLSEVIFECELNKGKNNIELPKISDGMYFIKFGLNDFKIAKKIIVSQK